MFGAFQPARGQTPTLTNRTPDAARITPTPTPATEQTQPPGVVTLDADPALYLPGTGPKRVAESQPDFAYYVCLRNVTRVLVSDGRGQTDDLFSGRSVQTIRSATYQFVGLDAVYIIVPANKTHSITFETNEPVMFLEIVKGRGNTTPDEAIRYRDLVLEGGSAKFDITPDGIGPLRLDPSHTGRFDSSIEPTVHLRGTAAHDTTGPRLTVRVLERTSDTVLIAIDAQDTDSGVKSVSYAFGESRDSQGGYRQLHYVGPFRVNLKQTSFLWAFAEDNAANRSTVIYELNK